MGHEGVGAGPLQWAGEQNGFEEEGGILKDFHAAPELVQLVGGEGGDDVRLVLLVGGKGGYVSDQLLQLIGGEEERHYEGG